jgi:amino acid transporter
VREARPAGRAVLAGTAPTRGLACPFVGVGDVSKRILLGRKLRSTQLGETLLPKRIALPVFASDALSSVAYAPDEVFIMLSVAGVSAYAWSWKIAICVAVMMLTVVASYRQNVHAYPSGGGDYEVATVNLGPTAGVTVASALLVDYVLTVAVSISSGVQNAASALGFVSGHEAFWGSVLVLVLAALNLRGVRESGTFFAIPTYGFMVGVLGMGAYGAFRSLQGNLPDVESAHLQLIKAPGYEGQITTVALVFLLARAFSSGCAALTGVEAISNGVPAFRKPKSRNAATTLLLLGSIAIVMLLSIIVLARRMGLKFVDPHDLDRLRLPDGSPLPDGYDQHTVIAQIARGVFSNFDAGFYFVIAMTGIILVLAANTAFNGFPVLASILAKDGFLPRQLSSRGDRLAYSNGILVLAFMAIGLIVAFDAEVTRLIQLYIVGVFVSFNLSQLGMIRHWTRLLRTEQDPAARRRMFRSRAINTFGLAMTAVVFVIVLLTKFLAGAWIAILAMGTFFMLMQSIRKHYDNVGEELAIEADDQVLPTRVHAIVLVSKIHKPTMRALAYAKATRPNVLEAVMVDADTAATARIMEEWDERRIDVPLKVLYSPYREILRPIVEYVRSVRDSSPRGVVAVYIPEYVVGRWWEQALHNQTALRLKGRLLFTSGVMVISVPFQLHSSVLAKQRVERARNQVRAGDVRRGQVLREDTTSSVGTGSTVGIGSAGADDGDVD